MTSMQTRRERAGQPGPWAEIERAARATAMHEPALRTTLSATVLSQRRPEHIVAALLSRQLADPHDVAAVETLVRDALGEDPAIRPALEGDLAAVVARDPACRSALQALLNLKGLHALQAHRVAHSLWRRGRLAAALWLAGRATAALGVDIHPAVPIGRGVVLDHASGVVIGETALIEDGVLILHGVTLGATGKARGDRHPKVRRGALLGAGAKVLGNIEVGAMSRVGAGSVVLDPVPENCTVAGVPARIVRGRMRMAA